MLEEVVAYRKQLENYCSLTIFDFDETAAVAYQRFRAKKVRIKTMDLKIAAVTISLNATLLTRNARDFIKVPGLRFEDWTKG